MTDHDDHLTHDELARRRARRDAAAEREAERKARAIEAIEAIRQQLREMTR